jgi:hypothetical protein
MENKENEIMDTPQNQNHINFNADDNNLYLEQENKIINEYEERRERIKNTYNKMYERYHQSQEFYDQFINLIIDYKQTKLKNIENLTNLLNNYFQKNEEIKITENNQIDTIKREFKEILERQIQAEKERINKLNLEEKKTLEQDKLSSKKLLENLNNVYDSYINSINEIEKKHLDYIRYFNNYEMKLIDTISQKNKNGNKFNHRNNYENDDINISLNLNINEEKNHINNSIYDEDEEREFNEMIRQLLKKEKKYRLLLKKYDENIHPKYLEFKKCIDDLSVYHNDFNEQENQLFTFIYLGYIISIESQHEYQKKDLNFENLTSINYQNYNEFNQLFESITFENYNTILIYPNKNDYHSCKELPPDIVIELSNIINSHFPYIEKMKEGDYEEPNSKIINNVTKKLFEGILINEIEENNIINVLKNSGYRLEFLKVLNTYRSKGKFELSNQNLIILGNIIRTIADLYDIKNKDYEVLKLLITMCQTYYTINYKKARIYLIRFIEDHYLFESEELWSFYIEESIEREIKAKNNNKFDDLGLDEETKNLKMNNIYFCVLLSVTQNILEFQIDKNIIMKIMTNLIDKKYKLIPEYIEQILALIDGTVYEKRKKFNVNNDILGKTRKEIRKRYNKQ